jgi:hypothetical protein
MNLTLPTVSQTTGPSWANQINSDLTVIDSHNHASGNGVAIPSAGLNINDDVGFGTHSAVGLGSTQYVNQLAPTAACAIYAFGGELYYNNASAVPIQITSAGSVVGPPGQWTNLAPPAIAGYNVGTGTFSFQSDALTFGTLQGASLKLQANTSSQPITLTASAATTAYVLTLPVVAPAQVGSLLASCNTGSMSWVTAGTSISITSSSISVTPSGVGTTQLADQSVTQAKMEPKLASGGMAAGLNSGPGNTAVFSSFTCNLVAGRPVLFTLESGQNTATAPAPLPALASLQCGGAPEVYIAITHPNGTTQTQMAHTKLGSGYVPLSAIQGMFNVVSTGTHTVQFATYCPTIYDQIELQNGVLRAFQL